MKTYGLPYTGSKDKIAEKICSFFPIKENFYDLFGGGGSITHYQLLQNNYKHYIYNEYNPLVAKTFKMAINGEFKNETRWISHEDFDKLKNTDPYVACCFSFGNDFQSYAYGKDVEPYKKALHYAIVFFDKLDYSDLIIIDDKGNLLKCSQNTSLFESKTSTRKSIKESLNFKKDYAVEVMGTDWLRPFYWYFNEFKDDLLIASEEYGFTYYITEATTTEYRINIKLNDNLDVSYDIKFRLISKTDKATAKELNDYLN